MTRGTVERSDVTLLVAVVKLR